MAKPKLLIIDRRVLRARQVLDQLISHGLVSEGSYVERPSSVVLHSREAVDCIAIASDVASSRDGSTVLEQLKHFAAPQLVLEDNRALDQTRTVNFKDALHTPESDTFATLQHWLNALAASPHPIRNSVARTPRTENELIVIGSSTGGIDALLTILANFDERCPPTAIVQHTGGSFSASLIRLLNNRCKASVIAAHHNQAISPGTIYIAAGDEKHLCLSAERDPHFELIDAPLCSGHRPSIDMLFSSAASLGHNLTAVLLTGMGKDGAEGLLKVRNHGGFTIAQDEQSSVVYGMPKAAAEIGAVDMQLPIVDIGPQILQGRPA